MRSATNATIAHLYNGLEAVPEVITDAKGKQRRIYRRYATPLEILEQLPDVKRHLKEGQTLAALEERASEMSDTEAARRMRHDKHILFAAIRQKPRTESWKIAGLDDSPPISRAIRFGNGVEYVMNRCVMKGGKPERDKEDGMNGGRRTAMGRSEGSIPVAPRHGNSPADHRPDKEFDGIMPGTLVFSPDGGHYGYAAFRAEKHCVVVDRRASPEYDQTLPGAPLFAPTGGKFAYAAAKDQVWRVYLNGIPGRQYEEVSSLTFSRDGNHLMFIATTGPRRQVVVDDIPSSRYGTILGAGPIFGADCILRFFAVRDGYLYRVQHPPETQA
jgi:hypothetical protein